MARLIINCDLGENECVESTKELMSLVDAANICCGVHAGSLEKICESLHLAKVHGVMVGAHPGLPRGGGRGGSIPSLSEFECLLETQVGGFLSTAKSLGVMVRYVKLHGTLYHAVEEDLGLSRLYCDYVKQLGPSLGIFALSGGQCVKQARLAGIQTWEEIFADRGYLASGALVPRSDLGALLGADEVTERYALWLQTGRIQAVDGELIDLSAETICVHSDSPDAVQLLRSLRT